MVFGRKRKDKVSTKLTETPVINRRDTTLQEVWRAKYDGDRAQAVVEERSCGKCIDGVVYFGPNVEDQADCTFGGVDCKHLKKESTE